MADLSEVGQALVDLCAATVYPAGTGQPSVVGRDVAVFMGWPLPRQLEEALAQGKLQVSVFPRRDGQNTTRYSAEEWETVYITEPTITATVAGDTVTLGGTVATPQSVVLLVDGVDYARGVVQGDSLSSIAQDLAALIDADRPATAAGPAIVIPDAREIVARFATSGVSARELRREDRVFQISIWAPTPHLRDAAGKPVDGGLAKVTRLPLPDGTKGLMRYRGSHQLDEFQKDGPYRRDLLYSVEYSTIETATNTTVAVPQTRVSSGPSFEAQGPQQIVNA